MNKFEGEKKKKNRIYRKDVALPADRFPAGKLRPTACLAAAVSILTAKTQSGAHF